MLCIRDHHAVAPVARRVLLAPRELGPSGSDPYASDEKAYRSLEKQTVALGEARARRLLSLPLYPARSDEDVNDVLGALERIVVSKTFASAKGQ